MVGYYSKNLQLSHSFADQIQESDQNKTSGGPIDHFMIDLRPLMIKCQIDRIIEKKSVSKYDKKKVLNEGFSELELCEFLVSQN